MDQGSRAGDPAGPEAPSVGIFLHKKWQLKDGKHPEESAEVDLVPGQRKSEVALEALGGGGGVLGQNDDPGGIT